MTSSSLGRARLLVVGTTEWIDAFAGTLETTEATLKRAKTAAAALEVLDREEIDCVVCEYVLPDLTGVELLEAIRDETTVPVVLGTASGSEAIASEAIGAGVTDYVVLEESNTEAVGKLSDRIEDAIRSGRRRETDRDRARQFDAIFRDTQTATWVLDPDGTLVRANRTAEGMIDADLETIVGDPFWTLPWWTPEAIEADVRRLLEKAFEGRFGNAVISHPPDAGSRFIDLSVRPIEDEEGELTSIVVEAVDITERVILERDLRRSEKLHRVTLNNMTDTVLITDEAGEYTYVCPNVHFVFGYTADEVEKLGTIEDLLGEDLFDRDELTEAGVLKNIECTTTDKAGREHTLLINVREVSIRDGALLYSCRDITKRKQREEALATLQGMAREFLYAETHREIAEHVVDDTPGILGLEASAVYLFDADRNDLRPIAHSMGVDDQLSAVRVDGETLVSDSFAGGEPLFFEDVRRVDDGGTGLRTAAYIPLGDHGVFVAGSEEIGAFDDVTREFADLLAATAEAALDRVVRESQLREQERTLQRQNQELIRLNRINEMIREVDQALVEAETQEGIDDAVCELLTGEDRFDFAWIGTIDPTAKTVEPRAWAGNGERYLESRSFAVAKDGEPAGRTAASGDVTAIANVASTVDEKSWRESALRCGYRSVLSIPLVYGGFTHGILTVYASTPDAFDETARAVLAEFGETIAAALSAIKRKNALLTTAVTRVEFAIDDPTFVLSRLARDGKCTLSYHGGVQQTESGGYVFVTVEDADIASVEKAASELAAIDGVQRITSSGDGGVLRLQLTQPFFALELADQGAMFRHASADPTATTLVIDVPESVDVRNITRLVRETFSNVDLRSKRTREQPTGRELYSTFLETLTDRQLEVIQTAYYSGFFESPRENTGGDIAETLGISPTAFYQHVRTVQRKLFTTLLEKNTPIAAGK